MDIQKVKRGYLSNEIKSLTAIGSNVLVTEMNFEFRVTTAGIILPGDDAKNSGIRPRWGKVYAIGPEQTDVVPGQWILVDHGRWTRGVDITVDGVRQTIRKVDNKDILLVSDEPIVDDTMGDKVV
jgi:co-chaperonin GroES (HSP10)